MAVTGLALFGFVIAHLLGNLQIFAGPQAMHDYAVGLRSLGALLWLARIGLLVAVGLHIWAAISLTRLKQAARPVPYRVRSAVQASYSSRTMMWSGPLLAGFVIFHLAHLTWGWVTPFEHLRPYENMVASFTNPLITLLYVVCMVALGFHLSHGAWSMFQTVGFNHPKYNKLLRNFARVATFLIVAGNIIIPLSVLFRVVK